jgi:RNA-directed DNA polymerase
MAGAQGSGVQRGQDARRLPHGRLRLPGIQRPPIWRQAADQTEQGGHQTDPGTTTDRATGPSRAHGPGRDQAAQPDDQGLGHYYRTHVAGEIFGDLDAYLWRLTWKWAVRSHANKPKSWIFARYFGRFNKARQDRWVFGDRQGGSYMHRFAWTNIVRHQTVRQRASSDDPELAEYWARRRSRTVLPINNTSLRLHKTQDGCCPICKTPLLADQPQTPSDWETWLTAARTTITIVKPATGTTNEADHRLIHARCANRSGPAILPAYQPTGLA